MCKSTTRFSGFTALKVLLITFWMDMDWYEATEDGFKTLQCKKISDYFLCPVLYFIGLHHDKHMDYAAWIRSRWMLCLNQCIVINSSTVLFTTQHGPHTVCYLASDTACRVDAKILVMHRLGADASVSWFVGWGIGCWTMI